MALDISRITVRLLKKFLPGHFDTASEKCDFSFPHIFNDLPALKLAVSPCITNRPLKNIHFQLPAMFILAFLLLNPLQAGSKIQCWTNSEGIRECGQAIPPEYSQQRVEIVNEHGVVVEVISRAKTPEELEEEKRQAEIRKRQERQKAEQRRQDMILLNTYATERDLRISRDRQREAINSIIEITRANTRTLEKKLAQVQKKIANYERAGEPAPASLFEEMDSIKEQIDDNQFFVHKKEKLAKRIDDKFKADLKRFYELKGIKPKSGHGDAGQGTKKQN